MSLVGKRIKAKPVEPAFNQRYCWTILLPCRSPQRHEVAHEFTSDGLTTHLLSLHTHPGDKKKLL